MKVPAVNVDIEDDGTHYIVTATPWPTIDGAGHPYRARLPRLQIITGGYGDKRAVPFTSVDLAAFVKKLMSTYPKASV